MNLNNKNIVITGGTSGIGWNLVKTLLRQYNCNICVIGRNKEKLEKIKQITNNRIFTIQADLRNKNEIDSMLKKLFTKSQNWTGTVDVFFANAGFGYYEKLEKANWEHINDIFSLNTFSPIYTLLKIREYIKDKPFQYVVTSSSAEIVSIAGYSLYISTKSALTGFFDNYLYEIDENIIISQVFPVAIKTPFYDLKHNKTKIPSIRQDINKNTQRTLDGVIKNKTHIYPSHFSSSYLFLNRFLPLKPLFGKIEQIRFENWLNNKN